MWSYSLSFQESFGSYKEMAKFGEKKSTRETILLMLKSVYRCVQVEWNSLNGIILLIQENVKNDNDYWTKVNSPPQLKRKTNEIFGISSNLNSSYLFDPIRTWISDDSCSSVELTLVKIHFRSKIILPNLNNIWKGCWPCSGGQQRSLHACMPRKKQTHSVSYFDLRYWG